MRRIVFIYYSQHAMSTARFTWSVGIYHGSSPLALAPDGARDPVLAREHVTDVPCASVADPFLLRRDGVWFLFVEVLNTATDRGELAYATSEDGGAWTYQGVVLREPFHLSYPQVFVADGEVYLVPETRQAGSIRLYAAERFPDRWRFVATLAEGPYADPTLLEHDGRWWMFAQRGLDELRLFTSLRVEGPWIEHPASPIRTGNRRITRPAGRTVRFDGRLVRFAQDGWPNYGSHVRALEIDRLNPGEYAEHEVSESPVLSATFAGWNAMGMHHVDAQLVAPGRWMAAVDGATLRL